MNDKLTDCIFYIKEKKECALGRVCGKLSPTKCSKFKTEEQRYAERYY